MSATCCPPGYYYIYPDGTFNGLTGLLTIGNDPVDWDPLLEKCVHIYNSNIAAVTGDPPNPIDCQCCPEGYTYVSFSAKCMNYTTREEAPGQICITCECPPTPTFACAPCETTATHISFSFDFTKRNCTDCTPQESVAPSGGIITFVPSAFVDPSLSSFRLRNKNFI